jgi:hypothetical protein
MKALSIKTPALANSCYCCKKDSEDYFCSEACELYYDTMVDHGLRKPDFVCEDCGVYMNPREGVENRICNACDFSEDDQWDTEYALTPAQAYRYMFPYTKPTPHDKDTAVAACNEFVETVNSAVGHIDKSFHAKFLFNYLADHGNILFEYPKFCEAVEGKMKEMEGIEATMNFYNLQPVFVKIRAMIASAQKED